MNNYPSNNVYLYSVHILFHTTVFNKTNKRQNKTKLLDFITVWETNVLLYLVIFAEVIYYISINLSVSIYQYQVISINLSVSVYQYQFISINLHGVLRFKKPVPFIKDRETLSTYSFLTDI